MIRLFGQTDTSFESNGDVVLKPLKAKAHKEDNGEFYLDFECGLEYVDQITEGRIIVVDLPQGAQAFRITNPQKTRKKITVKAKHVFYDSLNYLIVDSYVENKTCQQALMHLSNATEPHNPFTVSSDISTLNSYRCVRTSWHDAIMTVLDRWGGHLVRDNFSVAIRQSIAQDHGVVIRYAKNLKEISSQDNWSNVVTKLLPVGKDGLLLNALDPSASIFLEASTSYALPYTKTVTFEQDIDENDFEDSEGVIDEQAYMQALVDDLRSQATTYLQENCVPLVNYTLKANVENITDVGDLIEVIDERLGIDIFTNVIAYDYDCILKKYTQLEFGNFTPKLSNLVGHISTQIRQVESNAYQSVDAIWSTLSNSFVIYTGNEILVVDSLPKESAVNVIKIGNSGISYSTQGINGLFKQIVGINGTLMLAGQEIKDAIIDEGTSGSWTYKKYKNGTCECDATISLSSLLWSPYISYEKITDVTTTPPTTQTIALLFQASKSIDLPFNVTGAKATAQVTGSTIAWTTNVQEQANTVSIGLVAKTQSSSLTVNVHVSGAWN